jgi:hypothetical protein
MRYFEQLARRYAITKSVGDILLGESVELRKLAVWQAGAAS